MKYISRMSICFKDLLGNEISEWNSLPGHTNTFRESFHFKTQGTRLHDKARNHSVSMTLGEKMKCLGRMFVECFTMTN